MSLGPGKSGCNLRMVVLSDRSLSGTVLYYQAHMFCGTRSDHGIVWGVSRTKTFKNIVKQIPILCTKNHDIDQKFMFTQKCLLFRKTQKKKKT